MVQNLHAVGTGKEPMPQNMNGNLLSRGKHCGASALAARLLESWGQTVIVHHLGGRSPPKRPGQKETLKLGPSPKGQGRERIVARTPPKTPRQRKDCGSDLPQNAKAEKGLLLGNASLQSRSARYVMCAPGVCNGGLQWRSATKGLRWESAV